MANCKGLKGRKYTKCMKAYNAASKKIFPTFYSCYYHLCLMQVIPI